MKLSVSSNRPKASVTYLVTSFLFLSRSLFLICSLNLGISGIHRQHREFCKTRVHGKQSPSEGTHLAGSLNALLLGSCEGGAPTKPAFLRTSSPGPGPTTVNGKSAMVTISFLQPYGTIYVEKCKLVFKNWYLPKDEYLPEQ